MNWDKWAPSPDKPKEPQLSLLDRFGLMNAYTVTAEYKPTCRCEKCLMMCKTYEEYRASNKELGGDYIDVDDEWMTNFGCEVTRTLDEYVELTELDDKEAPFDHLLN